MQNSTQAVVGSFPFTITAGAATDVGTVDFATGNLTGSVIWNGVAVTNNSYLQIGNSTVGFTDVGADGSYSLIGVPIGTYDLAVFEAECTGAFNQVGQLDAATVSSGVTTTADIDITATAGRLSGTITLNGVPLPRALLTVTPSFPCDEWNADSSGAFQLFYPPGDYVATVQNSTQAVVGSFAFSIAAGQSTEYDSFITNAGSNISNAAEGGTSTVGGIELLFANVAVAGTTNVISSSEGPSPPNGFDVIGLDGQPRYWDVSTSASFSGSFEVCIHYDPTQLTGDANSLQLVDAGNGFTDITTSVNTTSDVICGTTTTTSTFAVVDQPL